MANSVRIGPRRSFRVVVDVPVAPAPMDGLFLTGPLPGGPTRHLPKPDLAQHLRYTLDGIHRKPQALVTRTGLCLCCDKLTELYGGSCLDCWDRSDDD